MKKSIAIVLWFLASPVASAFAQDPGQDAFQTVRFHRVHLRNGNVIDGDLVQLNDREALLKIRVGEIAIRRGQIDRIEFIKMRTIRERPPVVMEKPKAAKPVEPGAVPVSVKASKEPMAPLPSPSGVSELLRANADALVAAWERGQSSDRQLARQFEELGVEITPYLSLLLEQRTMSVPAGAISVALGRLGDPRAIPGLSVALGKGDQADDRKHALESLIKFGTAETYKPILEALNDPSSDVWKAAKDHLVEKFRKGELPDLPDTLSNRMGNAENKLSYALALGGLDSPTAHKELLYLLSTGDEFGRRAAVQGLSVRPSVDDGLAITRLLSTRDTMVQREACLFLGKCKFAGAVPDLIELMGEENPGLVSNVHWALREITGERLASDQKLWKTWFEGSTLRKNISK